MYNYSRIYVASLSDYNNGVLHGVWLDCFDVETMQEAINLMLSESTNQPAEDWAIHDSSGFGTITMSEFTDLEDVVLLAELLDKHNKNLVSELYEYFGKTEDIKTVLEDHYIGCYSSMEDYCENSYPTTNVPDHFKDYIDWEQMGDDVETELNVFYVDGEVHIFSY